VYNVRGGARRGGRGMEGVVDTGREGRSSEGTPSVEDGRLRLDGALDQAEVVVLDAADRKNLGRIDAGADQLDTELDALADALLDVGRVRLLGVGRIRVLGVERELGRDMLRLRKEED
jgi:hypothetical protein